MVSASSDILTAVFFRPVAMALGPDGALYIADFYTQIFENMHFSKRHPGRDHRRGRIWRISHPDRPLLKQPRTKGEPVKALLGLLKSHESSTREFARRELQQRPAGKVIPALDEWLKNLNAADPEREHHRTEALWVRQGLNEVDAILLQQQLKSANPSARAAATKVLRYWQEQIGSADELIRQMVNDPEPRVRLHAVIAASFSASPEALAIAMEDGKLGGVPVELLVDDDGRKPEKGRQIAERFIKKDKAKILTGIVFSNVAMAVVPKVVRQGIFYVSPNAGPSRLAGKGCDPNYFNVA